MPAREILSWHGWHALENVFVALPVGLSRNRDWESIGESEIFNLSPSAEVFALVRGGVILGT